MQTDDVNQLSVIVRCFKCGCFGHRGMECERHTLSNPNAHLDKCWICGCLGHIAVECKEKTVTCFSCGERGHKQSECQSLMANCWNCGEKGHIKRTCPLKKNVGMCFYCHEVGHHSKECTQKACFNCSSKDHLWTQCPLKGSRGFRRRPRRENCKTVQDDECARQVKPFSLPLLYQNGYSYSPNEQVPSGSEGYSPQLRSPQLRSFNQASVQYPQARRHRSAPLPRQSWNQGEYDQFGMYNRPSTGLLFEQQNIPLPMNFVSRQVQQTTTPRQDDIDVLDIMGPLYRPEQSPPLTTSAIRANSVPALPNDDNVWGARTDQGEFVEASWGRSSSNSWNNDITSPFASEELTIKEQNAAENKKSKNSKTTDNHDSQQCPKFEIDPSDCTAAGNSSSPSLLPSASQSQGDSQSSGMPFASPRGSLDMSNNTSESPVSKFSVPCTLTMLEHLRLESRSMSKSLEQPMSEENAIKELKRVKNQLLETQLKLAETEEKFEKTQQVVLGLKKVINLENQMKTKSTFVKKSCVSRCASCIELLETLGSCKKCVKA